jgi:hypothetical protein
MNLGEEIKTTTIEPLSIPVPQKESTPDDQPTPQTTPTLVPATRE